MKKAYIKPEAFCEEYELSVSIAAHCAEWMDQSFATLNDIHACNYKVGRRYLFMESSAGCTTIPRDGDYGICYNQPTDESTVFVS